MSEWDDLLGYTKPVSLGGTGLAASSYAPGSWNGYSYQPSASERSSWVANSGNYTPGMNLPSIAGAGVDPAKPDDGSSWWDSTKDVLGNKDLMSGIQGMGQLGLGLASYLQMKPLYEEQLAGLKQNRQFAAENQQNRRNIASDLG